MMTDSTKNFQTMKPQNTLAGRQAVVAVHAGVARLRELWGEESFDEQALASSEPTGLALALRALTSRGPPEAL